MSTPPAIPPSNPAPPPISGAPVPPRHSSNWINRNWLWFVPAVILLAVGFICGLVFLIFTLMRSSDAYAGAVSRAKSNPAVIAALGSPVTDSFFVMGSIQEQNSGGFAHLTIPLQGPKAKATLYVDATRSHSEWSFDTLTVAVAGTGQRIDLLDTNQLSSTNSPPR